MISLNNLENSKKNEIDDIWNNISSSLKEEFGDNIYNRWLSKIKLFSFLEQEVIMSVPSKFFRDWIKREYLNHGGKNNLGITGIILKFSPKIKKVLLIFLEENKTNNASEDKNNIIKEKKRNVIDSEYKHQDRDYSVMNLGTNLNPKFTFNNLIIGNYNKLACKIAKIICNTDEYSNFSSFETNPLFIYGGVGLGKTHLAQSIAWKFRDNNKNTKVLYLSAERFMYQFVQSLKNKDIMDFKQKFRSIDLLIIDDLHFIAGKEGTQEELLYSINSLIENQKQIILVCDRAPGNLNNVDKKLKSKFSGGIIVDLKYPDYLTRLQILKFRSKEYRLDIKENILEFLSSKLNSSVRDLEGAIKKIAVNKMLNNEEIDLYSVENLLKDVINSSHVENNLEQIQKAVSKYFNVKISDMKSKTRIRTIVIPRQICMYIANKLTDKNLVDIGREFNRNHATVIYSIKKVKKILSKDRKYVGIISGLEENLVR